MDLPNVKEIKAEEEGMEKVWGNDQGKMGWDGGKDEWAKEKRWEGGRK